jgi:hypothetical protein
VTLRHEVGGGFLDTGLNGVEQVVRVVLVPAAGKSDLLVALKLEIEADLPRVRIYVVQDDLVAGDGLTGAIEDEEARRRGALVNTADKPILLQLGAGFGNAPGQSRALEAEAFGRRALITAHDAIVCLAGSRVVIRLEFSLDAGAKRFRTHGYGRKTSGTGYAARLRRRQRPATKRR